MILGIMTNMHVHHVYARLANWLHGSTIDIYRVVHELLVQIKVVLYSNQLIVFVFI